MCSQIEPNYLLIKMEKITLTWQDLISTRGEIIYFTLLDNWMREKDLQDKLHRSKEKRESITGTDLKGKQRKTMRSRERSSQITIWFGKLKKSKHLIGEHISQGGRLGDYYWAKPDLVIDYICDTTKLTKDERRFIKILFNSRFYNKFLSGFLYAQDFKTSLRNMQEYMTFIFILYLWFSKCRKYWMTLKDYKKIKDFDEVVSSYEDKRQLIPIANELLEIIINTSPSLSQKSKKHKWLLLNGLHSLFFCATCIPIEVAKKFLISPNLVSLELLTLEKLGEYKKELRYNKSKKRLRVK